MEAAETQRPVWWILVVLVFLFGIPECSVALDKSQPEEMDRRDIFILDEIIVTATKTGETSIQETAMAMSAFDKERLEGAGIVDIWDIDLVTPNMAMGKHPRTASVWIRGVGSVAGYPGGHDAVAVYVNDAYTTRYTGLYSTFLDTEFVEILLGPQGTLYGRNTAAGAIRIQTGMPTEEPTGFIDVEYGSESKHGFSGVLSGPIVEDKLKARLAFSKLSREGYFQNRGPGTPDTIDDEDRTSARAIFQFNQYENVDLVLSGEYHEVDNEGGEYWTFENPAPFVAAGAQPYEPLKYTTTNPDPMGSDRGINQETKRIALTGRFSLPRSIALKSITAYNHHEWRASFDHDGTTMPLFDLHDQFQAFRAFTQEFQINITRGNLTIIGGLFYLYEKEWNTMLALADYGSVYTIVRDFGHKGDSYAAYVSGTYAISGRLSLTAGTRYSYDRREMHIDNLIAVGDVLSIPYDEASKKSWSDISPKITIDYRLTDDAFAYASISRGYKAGGWNGTVTSYAEPFDEEYIWSYEAGTKTDWFGKRLRANLVLFYYDYQNMQLLALTSMPGGGYAFTMRNATDSSVIGAELDVTARPVPSLTLGTAASLAYGEYGSYLLADIYGNIVDRKGEKFFFTPEWQISAFASYVIPVKEMGYVSFDVNYKWQDSCFDSGVDGDVLRIDARGILNARMMLESSDGKWFADIYGRNLTDERYWVLRGSFSGIGPATADNPAGLVASDARNFGVRLGYRF